MADDSSHIHKPNARELPVAKPGIAGILFRCYEERLSVEEAVEDCRKFGAKYVGPQQVEEAYSELSRIAEKLNNMFAAYFEHKVNAGDE